VLTLAINNVAHKEETAMKMLLVLGVRNPQSTACDVEAFVSRIKRKSLIIFFFLGDTVSVFTYMSLYA
jgi:hypothetical protein